MHKNSRSSFFTPLNLLLVVVGIGLLSFSAFRFWEWYSHTSGSAPSPQVNKIITRSTNTPDERPVSQTADYSVPADQPKKIIIPAINVSGFVQPVGTDQNKQVGVPTNIHFAGWYVERVKPGDAGLSVIDGHVSSRYGSALFARLKELAQGDQVQVQFGDDSARTFEVIDTRRLPEPKTATFLLTQRDDITQQLNLVTCGGVFDTKSDHYNDRVVVVTKRIK